MRILSGHSSRCYVAVIIILAASLVTAGRLDEPVRAQAVKPDANVVMNLKAQCTLEVSVTAQSIGPAPSDRAAFDLVKTGTAYFDPCLRLHLYGRRISAEPVEDKTPWTQGDIISAEDLSKLLSSSRGAKPVILQVGIEGLYREAHIPDSIFAGPAAEPEGLDLLKAKVKGIARTRELVLYCGCCPWKDCPNIRPAFVALQQMGFKKVKLLNIPTDFHQDWINKGFPTMRS
ncbi:MAG TPA: hypothetical protein VKJ45_21135 [Blastocatellia bacterium]|nr:hypothetical protein [Blastocatellia bacterium]